MRKISQWQDFSYRHPANCYFTISEEGVPVQIWNTLSEMERIYQSVKNGETDLYVAVPGETTTDIFHVDDIELLGREYGFCEGHLFSKFSLLVKKEVNETEYTPELVICVKTHIWRKIRYETSLSITEEQIRKSLQK